jgi:ankyrin repeat protein
MLWLRIQSPLDQAGFFRAIKRSDKRYVELGLLQRIVAINAADRKSRHRHTALIYACDNGHEDIVKMLLKEQHIDVNFQDKYGLTALMYACLGGYTEIVKLLLGREDIDIHLEDKEGKMAYDWCDEISEEVQELLK